MTLRTSQRYHINHRLWRKGREKELWIWVQLEAWPVTIGTLEGPEAFFTIYFYFLIN